MRRAAIRVLVSVMLVTTARVWAQTDPKPPAFEVASIKANKSGSPRSGIRSMAGGRVEITNKLLRDLIRTAYGSSDLEVLGGPDWIDADRWDIAAAPPPGAGADTIWEPMLKSLLAERFALRAHVEQRMRPIYKLVLARPDKGLGPEIHRTACDDNADCSGTRANGNGIKSGTIIGTDRGMDDLAVTLSPYVERRVFDATGLEGHYDFNISWSEDMSIFTALAEQLGLKVEAANGPVDVVVVDHVEHPTED